MDTSTPIVVFSCFDARHHHGGLGIARSAGRLGIPVYARHDTRLAPVAFSRYGRYGGRRRSDESPEQAVEALLRLGKKLGRAVLVPIDDVAVLVVAEHREALRERFVFGDLSPEQVRMLSDKAEMWRASRRLGIDVPETVFPESEADVRRHAAEAAFPVVVKQIAGWYAPHDPAARSVEIACTPEQLLDAYRRVESAERPNAMLQEYIPGGPDSIWMYNGYFDERSDCLVGFCGRKLRQRHLGTGATTLGVCESRPQVTQMTWKLMKDVGYRGILDMGYRYDARDGRYKLLDINPRIGATFRLFVGDDGMDVLRALYLDLTGQPVPSTRMIEGRRWVVEADDLIGAFRLSRKGHLGMRAWRESLRGVQEGAWWALDDPLPFLVHSVELILDGGQRLRARRAHRVERGAGNRPPASAGLEQRAA
jgi:predicted ATP-grasp superfamily ATP-dependent carboligase